MKRILKSLFRNIIIRRRRKELLKSGKELLTNFQCQRLTANERKEVKEYWGELGYKVDMTYPVLFKTINYYDKKFLPEDLYASVILASLNPRMDSFVYVNKGMYDSLFKMIPQPRCFVKNIGGVYWNERCLLDKNEVVSYIETRLESFIIKPSVGTFGGAKVKKINLNDIGVVSRREYIEDLLRYYKTDFVIQEVVDQHIETAQFNAESLNTFRICSLFLNGKLSILTRLLRCGQNGSVVDNGFAGGIMVPVMSDGRLAKYGLDHVFNKYEKSSNGIVFDGIILQHYSKLEQFIEKYHVLFPTCHLIAWDLAIDKNGSPLMIEVNLISPGITEEQVSIGPFFGDRTDEVIKYVKENPGKMYMTL